MGSATAARIRLLTREEAERIARQVAGDKLRSHEWISEEHEDNLVLGTSEEEGKYTFRLYVSGQTAGDARVLFSATVDRRSGKAQVEVFLSPKQGSASVPEPTA